MMIIWFILIIVIIIVIYDKQDLFSSGKSNNTLDERLAKGEITIEEYNKIKEEISK